MFPVSAGSSHATFEDACAAMQDRTGFKADPKPTYYLIRETVEVRVKADSPEHAETLWINSLEDAPGYAFLGVVWREVREVSE